MNTAATDTTTVTVTEDIVTKEQLIEFIVSHARDVGLVNH